MDNKKHNNNKLNKYKSLKSSKRLSKRLGKTKLEKKPPTLNDLVREEDIIARQFRMMDFEIKNIKTKPSYKIEEKINIDVDGNKKRTITKDKIPKKIRRRFRGCSIQTKTRIYEKEQDDLSDKNKYYESKEILRVCPKTTP